MTWIGLGLAVAGLLMTVFGLRVTGAAYRNGFADGVSWTAEGDSYPSKPESDWRGWSDARRRRGRLLDVPSWPPRGAR